MSRKRQLYPVDEGGHIAHPGKDTAGWRCQLCGKQCRQPGEPFDTYRRTLTAAHWDRDLDSDAVFVVALGTPCHLLHDAQHKAAMRKSRQMD